MDKITNKIICDDVIQGLNKIDDETVHLTFTSPPYNCLNNSGAYDKNDDNLEYEDYLNWLKNIFEIIYKKTVHGGRVAINIDAVTNRTQDKDQEYIRAIYPHLYDIMKKIGWKFRTEINWYKQNAVGKATAWGSFKSSSNPIIRRNHEYILVWSKGDWKLESEHLSDLTKKEFEQYTLSTWHISPQTKKLCGHPAPFPEELAKRVIKLFSFPEQVVLDPFVGTGTTCKMTYLLNRKYIGIDNSEKYCEFARKRIGQAEEEKQILQFSLTEELEEEKKSKDRKTKKDKEVDIFG